MCGRTTTVEASAERRQHLGHIANQVVVDFGVIHHVPAWEDAIREVCRVLKPGGIFVFEEVSKQALDRWVYRALFKHPKENRFTAENFVAALEHHGMPVGSKLVSFFFGDFFAGVGQRRT